MLRVATWASLAGADGAVDMLVVVTSLLIFALLLVRAIPHHRQRRRPRVRVAREALHRLRRPRVATAQTPGGVTRAGQPDEQRATTADTRQREHGARPDGQAPVAVARARESGSGDGEAVAPLVDVAEPELRRVPAAILAPLGGTLERSRRLHAAEDRVARELRALPVDFWLVERYVLVGARRVPFLVAGATGVFVIWPSDGAWTLEDLHAVSGVADEVLEQLPGYDGPVHGAVCLAFDEMAPRAWYGGAAQRGHGGWVLGIDWLRRWMFGVGPQHGLRNGDVRRLEELARARWERRSTARLPATKQFG